ncbi:ribonuclease H-like domain-containing protein [Globomyces pollinis-pini]|nr:ribonuclease H-like domain-containing protein [Globomyces pollinis-pini]
MKDSRPQPFAYYLVLDFEGTCDENSRFDYASEIIEFPVILIDGQTLQIVDQFHRYVRPILQPTLTEFCISLTGITQEMVDKADPFDQVYNEFKTWLETYCPKPFNDCVFVTDGPWDLRDFFEKEITYYGMVRPDYMKSIINLRKQFQDYYKTSGNLNSMLSFLKMEFQGRPHSGIDDATNLARIFLHMANDGCRMDINTKLRKIKKSKWAQLRK